MHSVASWMWLCLTYCELRLETLHRREFKLTGYDVLKLCQHISMCLSNFLVPFSTTTLIAYQGLDSTVEQRESHKSGYSTIKLT